MRLPSQQRTRRPAYVQLNLNIDDFCLQSLDATEIADFYEICVERHDGRPPSARRIVPDEPVHRLPDEVGMADVPRVLLDQVDQETPQAGCPTVGPGALGQLVQAAVGQHLRGHGAGAGLGVTLSRPHALNKWLE